MPKDQIKNKNSMSNEERRTRIVNLTNNLKEENYVQIYNLIEQYSSESKMTKNMNGYFVNLNDVSDTAIDKIENYLEIIKEVRKNDEIFKKKLHRKNDRE